MKSIALALAVLGQSPQSSEQSPGFAAAPPQAPALQAAPVRFEARRVWEVEPGTIRLPRLRLRREEVGVITVPAQQAAPQARAFVYYAAQPTTIPPAPIPLQAPGKALAIPGKAPEAGRDDSLDRIERILSSLDARLSQLEAGRTDDKVDLPPLPKDR